MLDILLIIVANTIRCADYLRRINMRLIIYILLLGLIILTGAQFFKDYGKAQPQKSFNQAQEIIQQQQDLLNLDASALE